MPDSLRPVIRGALIVVALGIILAGLWPTTDAPRTAEERTAQIAAQIRCPFCNGESIGEATSQVARDLELVIAEQVRSGMSDDQIYAYFADRYGESILLAPPLRGWGWGLWAVPLAALGVGAGVIWYRRRAAGATGRVGPEMQERSRVAAAVTQVEQDLVDIERQHDAGEIDAATLATLTATYTQEKDELVAALEILDGGEADDREAEPAGSGDPSPGPGRRRLVGAAVLVVGAVAVTLFAINSADRTGNDATAGVVDAPPIDLSNVTTEQLEAVVAANPDVIGMRLALAQVLMQEGEIRRALGHYVAVLERERHPEALAWVGFISFQANRPEEAENYLVEALEKQPNYPQAQWWLANVRYVGLGDPAGAIEPLEALLVFDDVPNDIREAAVELLAQARAEA